MAARASRFGLTLVIRTPVSLLGDAKHARMHPAADLVDVLGAIVLGAIVPPLATARTSMPPP
jgi:hypothetical protein